MRYEDASGSFSSTAAGTPDARDDADSLAAGSHGPATGNTITGAGTITGSAGADIIGDAPGHIVALQGAGGDDSSDGGASLHVAGRFGSLTMDENGNYSYRPNGPAPENARDVFRYTLADHAGARDTATLTIEVSGKPLKVDANAQQLVPGPDGVVTLPPGVELSDVHVVGRNLVIDMPDGSQMVIIDGAVFVPQLVLGGVEVPATNLAALLIDSEPQPAGGIPQSSGGNFDVPVPPLDPGVPLGDLIPPTELVFTPPEFHDIGQFIDRHPDAGSVSVQLDDDALPGGNPGGVGDDADNVNSVGFLPGSGGDGALTWDLLSGGAPAGFSYVDGPNGSILVQQVQGGNTVTVLTITINASTGAYTVTENAAILHPPGDNENNVAFVINYTVTDSDGDAAPGTLNVNVDDDTPTVSVTAGSDAEISLTTHDAATIGANSEAVSTSANFGGVFNGTTISYGADGPGVGSSSGYALSTTGGTSGLTQHGVAINLYNVSGVIVGSTATTAAGIDASNTVFTVSTTNTGVVTLTQFSQIDHTNTDPSPTDAPFTDQSISLADGSITLTRNETVVDRDGDSVTGSASVGIGANLHFVDDGPTISVADHSEPQLTVDETDLNTNATASFVANFSASFGADGPAANSITYALGISAPGANSGLLDTATGQAIVLVQNGAVVEGHVGNAAGAIAFTVSVNAAGDVTLDQVRAVVHPDANNPDTDETVTLSADNLVTLTATAHDFDGDTASATINIGTNLVFHDDGPTAAVGTTGQTVSLDETVGVQGDSNDVAGPLLVFAAVANKGVDPDMATQFAANANAIVNSAGTVFGADGGSAAFSLNVSSAGVDSGLNTTDGHDILLTLEGGIVVGRVSGGADDGKAAFAISIDSTGHISMVEWLSIQHPNTGNPDDSVSIANGAVLAVVTATDGDGDTSTASTAIGGLISFQDDGPTAAVGTTGQTVSLDETVGVQGDSNDVAGPLSVFAGVTLKGVDPDMATQFAANANAIVNSTGTVFGSDGPGTAAFSLNVSSAGVDSGLNTTDGHDILLTLENGIVVGRVSGGADDGKAAFAISIDSTGHISMVEWLSIQHPNTGNPDDSVSIANGAVLAVVTATDGDGDTSTASTGIGNLISFQDDGPSINVTATSDTAVLVQTQDHDTIGVATDTASSSANFGGIFGLTSAGGSDGAATTPTLSFVLGVPGAGASGVDSGLDQTGANIYLYTIGGKVVGSTSATLVGVTGANTVFDVAVSGTGVVTLTQYSQIDHPIAGDPTPTITPFADHIVSMVDSLVTLTASASITDGDGDTATDSETVNIGANLQFADDGPIATNDTDSIIGGNGPATGNVITGVDIIGGDANSTDGNADSVGADTPGTITRIVSVNNSNVDTTYDGSGNLVVIGQYGTLTINANGNYSYLRTDGSAGGVSDVFTYTLTDRDGDTATATLTIGIADNFPTAGNVNVVVDDDDVVGANGNPGGPGDVDPSNATGNLPGSGGDGALTWDLLTTGAPAGFSYADGPSGSINVFQDGNPNPVMNITINTATGAYTITELQPILHPSLDGLAGDNTENNVSFTINYTVTDVDGDPANGTLHISVNDDTPTIDVTKGADAGVILTTDDAQTILAATDTATSSANFGGVFGLAFSAGADGTNTTPTLGYALGVPGSGSNGVDSGLDQHGSNIYLYVISGAVVGSTSATLVGVTGGNTVFNVAVSGTGVVTLTQFSQIDHPLEAAPNAAPFNDQFVNMVDSLITLTASSTITDKDGDTATDQEVVNIGANLHFTDDGPDAVTSATAIGTATLDETRAVGTDTVGGTAPTGLASATIDFSVNFVNGVNVNYGADGPGSTVYSLALTGTNVNSGLYALDVADLSAGDGDGIGQGTQIVLNLSGNTITGSVGATNYFTIAIDPTTGVATFTQLNNIWNPIAGSSAAALDDTATLNTLAANLIQVVQTVTDFDGDTDTASINIGQGVFKIQDDGPRFTAAIQSQQADNDPTHALAVGTLHFAPGTDGAGGNMTITANVTGITSGGHNLLTVQSGNVLTAYQDTNNDGIHQVGETTAVFTITVNPTAGASGQYVFDLINPLDPTVTETAIGGSSSFGAGPTSQGQVLDNVAGTAHLAVVSGYHMGGTFNEATWLSTGSAGPTTNFVTAGVNGSTAGWGIDNNNFNGTDEMFVWDFGSQPLRDPDGAGAYVPAVGVTLPDISTATYDLIGYNSLADGNFATGDDITYVVHYTDGTFASGHIPEANVDSGTWKFTAAAGKFIADIEMFTSGTGSGKVDLVSVGVQSTSIDKSIAATVTLSDVDGDTTSASAFTIHISTGLVPFAPAAPVVLDLNGDGVHFLATDAGVHYDYGSGLVATAWASPQDGILVHDTNHNGTVDGASEFVFGSGGVTDLQALVSFDTNGDGQLSAADADFGSFAVWQDANSNGVVDAGEFMSLTAAGITSISLSTDGVTYQAAGGDVTVAGTGTYTNADGSTGTLADASFQTGAATTDSSTSTDLQRALSTAANNNSVLLGAIAAAGLGAETAAAAHAYAPANGHASLDANSADGGSSAVQGLSAANDDSSHSALSGESHEAVDAQAQAGSSSLHAQDVVQNALTAGGESHAQAPTALLAATEAGAQSAPAQSSFTSGGVAMPSAAMLAAANANGHAVDGPANTNAEIGRVLVDALAGGGHGPSIDAVINAVANQGHGDQAAANALASHGGAPVSGWDMGNSAGFTADHAALTMDHVMALHAAVQPAA